MSPKLPETSIIIRAFNEERWLPEVFSALERQKYRDFEVLLVDSGSVDRTRDIAFANRAKIVRLRSEDFTFGHSLNVGIKEACGSFIAILSAHAIPRDESWLEALVAPLRQPDIAMVYGGQRGHSISKFSEVRDFERIFPLTAHQVNSDDPFVNNANSAIKRSLWEVHPFDEGLPGLEDIEWAKFCMEQGLRVLYTPEACVIHVHEESWEQVRRRYYREGMAARWVGLRLLRHIPGECWRELRRCVDDIWAAALGLKLWKLGLEILRFRYEKIAGTVGGIIDSRGLNNPARRAELFSNQDYPAVVVRGPHRMRLEMRTLPRLKPGEILIRVSHVGVCATDFEIVDGTLGYYRSGKAHYPIIPGHEMSGTVVALGPRVADFDEGNRVVVECIQGCGECKSCMADVAIRCHERREVGVMGQDGAYAAYMVTRARYAHRIPETLTLAQAALTEPLAVVIKGLRRLGSKPSGDRPRKCAVYGAGTIGHLAAQILSLRGHSVTVIDKDAGRLSLLNGQVHTAHAITDLSDFDWFVEATGVQVVLSHLVQESPTGAALLLLGLPYADQSFNFESVVAFDRSITGSVGSGSADFQEALMTLEKIDTEPFLREFFPLSEFEKALIVARSRSSLKVMLKANGGKS